MAPLANHFSFFLLIVFVSSLHIEARVGKFLIENTYNYAPISETPTLAPSISPAPAPIGGEISYAPTPSEGEAGYAPTPIEVGTGYAPAPVESDNPYGLYGGDSTEFLPEKTITATTIGNDEDEIPVDEIANERLGEYNAGNQYSIVMAKSPNMSLIQWKNMRSSKDIQIQKMFMFPEFHSS